MTKRIPLLLLILLLLASPAFAQTGDGGQTDSAAPAPPAPAVLGVVTGTVTNNTPGGELPASGEPMLHIWDAAFQEQGMVHGELAPDGTFRFEEVPFTPGWQYAVMLNYQDVTYYSNPSGISAGQSELAVELPVYEATTATDDVHVTRQHILFDAAAEDQVLVAEIFVLSNRGDRSVALPADADPAAAPLAFVLPEGAENVGLENNTDGRFKPTEAGFVDTAPLRPGEGTAEVVVRYTLPYEDALAYTFTTQWPVSGLNVLLPARTGLSLEGEGLAPLETRPMGDAGEVAIYEHADLAAGETLVVNLSGELNAPPAPAAAPATAAPASADTGAGSVLPALLTTLGIFVIGLAVWVYRRPQPEPAPAPGPATTFDALVAEIALLDQAHEAGRIDETDYSRRRSLLFARAEELLPEGQ